MKTSNKLLIILATVLFVTPIIGMVIYAKSSRVDGRQYEAAIKDEGENPKAADQFLISRKVENFNKVVIDGENNLYTTISVIKSDQPLVKFSKDSESLFTTSVDDSGTLHIKKKPENKFYSSGIFVFAPTVDSLTLNKLQVAKFETNFDRIVIASEVNNGINFGENKNLKSLDLTIRNSHSHIGSSKNTASYLTGLENFNLHIIDGGVSLMPASFKSITLDLQNSKFNFVHERDGDKNVKASVQSLIVNTLGNSALSLSKDAVEFGNINGSLSDSTTTDLPIYILKDLFSKQ